MSDLPLPEPVQPDVLDIQHDTDPEDDHSHARRIPHLGHALLFFGITALCILTFSVILLGALHATTAEEVMRHPFAAALSQLFGYLVTLAIAFPVFPLLWQYSFLRGIHWTWRAARLRWWQLLLLGCALSVMAQGADHFIELPSDSDLMKLFTTPLAAWVTTIVGGVIAPLFEEIAFRGFLLPALATAYDWLSLERSPAGLDRWQRTTDHTMGAFLFGAVFSSAAFTAMHGGQLHWAAAPLAGLFVVSVVFAAVRIRTQSVAASCLVHFAYDGLIFLELVVSTGGFRHLDRLTQ